MIDRNDKAKIISLAKNVFAIEAQAISALSDNLDTNFADAVNFLLACSGRVVVTGMGKSGHIGGKIAATLASTGTPAFFVHPGEASHGDLGMITKEDTVIAISNSGETSEILSLLPMLKRFGITLIAITGQPNSTLATAANTHLNISVKEEACPLGLAPTSSTTATLAMGDALAIAALKCRGFTKEEFAMSHPGGALGKRLLLLVGDLMQKDQGIPLVNEDTPLIDTLTEMTEKALGLTCIQNSQGKLVGIYTDGDLRRTLLNNNFDMQKTKVKDVMTRKCKSISANTLAAEALEIMEKNKITSLVVVNNSNIPEGIIHMHHLLQAGLA